MDARNWAKVRTGFYASTNARTGLQGLTLPGSAISAGGHLAVDAQEVFPGHLGHVLARIPAREQGRGRLDEFFAGKPMDLELAREVLEEIERRRAASA